MANYWMVRSERGIRELVEKDGFVAIGFGGDVIGDIGGFSSEQITEKVRQRRPDATPRQISSDTSQLYRFAWKLQVDDRVITSVGGRQYLIGRITSDYRYVESSSGQPYQRSVGWTDRFSLDSASEHLRKSLSIPPTVYSLSHHEDEILQLIGNESGQTDIPVTDADALKEDTDRLETKTRQYILDQIVEKYPANEFEKLVGWVLTAMGLEVEGHGRGADAGVDLIARHGPFNFEQIVVQVKNQQGPVGNGDILKLRGTREYGRKLFVTSSAFTRAAIREAGTDIRLVTGLHLVDLIIEYYDQLPKTFRDNVPLRRVDILVPDVEESA